MSVRPDFKGDYMGFTYNNIHSSDLGIVRTSDGSRFNENLLPTMQDKTVQVPGGDGTYYFGSYYTQRQFSVSFAFDSLTEQQVAKLKSHFGDKKIHDLIFDERPYKIYRAKVTGTATLKYIPFSEGNTNRLYKGEGTIQFTCYDPFARFAFKRGESLESCVNYNEWKDAINLDWDTNFGDVPVSFTKLINSDDNNKQLSINGKTISWEKLPANTLAKINTKTGVVTKVIEKNGEYVDTTELLNRYFTGDLTMKIPVGCSEKLTTDLDVIFTPLFF